jgi:hypothetical protein
MKKSSAACTQHAENSRSVVCLRANRPQAPHNPKRSLRVDTAVECSKSGPAQVRNFRRFRRRALELAGRRPWLAFLS